MTDAETFRAWRASLEITQPQAADRLGVSLRWVKYIEAGQRANRSPPALSLTLRLAMAAVARRMRPWSPQQAKNQN